MGPLSNNYFTRIARNNEYYGELARREGGRAPAGIDERAFAVFTARLPATGMVLGVGSGDGQDLRRFKERGYTVLGVEPSEDLRRASIASGVPAVEGTFENLASLRLPSAVGIWCGAALRHVPESMIPRVIGGLSEALVSEGAIVRGCGAAIPTS